jgi:hypothetical protein
MDTFLTWIRYPALTWFAAAIVGGVIGAYINGLVARRLKRVGRLQFLRTRIVADKPKDADALASNRYVLELRMHNTSGEPKVVESPVITFNLHKRGTARTSSIRLESPMTKMVSNDPDVGMNIPFRLKDVEGKPLEYVVVPPGDVKVVPVEIETQTFDFGGVPEPRPHADEDLQLAFQGSHVLIHFRYPSDKRRHCQVIVDTTDRQGWEDQHVVYFPQPADATEAS